MSSPIQHIDLFENFILHSELTWSEHLVYNYWLKYRTKEDAIWYARVFFSNSPVREAYDRVVNKFKLLEESIVDGKIILMPNHTFEKNIVRKAAKDSRWRPNKEMETI